MNQQALNVARQRIIIAITKISEKLPSQNRAYVDAYLNHVSPSLASRGDANFPMSLRRHPVNSERTVVEGRSVCLCFAIGNAISGYYDAVSDVNLAGEHTGGETEQKLERRVMMLEDIAEFGFDNFALVGDIRTGYTLERRASGIPAKKPVQASGQTVARGAASSVVAK